MDGVGAARRRPGARPADGGRVAGTEVREVSVTQRSATGRAIEMRVQTDLAEATFRRFDVRQAVGNARNALLGYGGRRPGEEKDFVFLGRGWGHGVGMCQNGAFGMALAGRTYDQILTPLLHGDRDRARLDGDSVAAPSTR